MKFLVDAQLPRLLVSRLRDLGFEAIHTLDLPMGNGTPDSFINELSIREEYIVITKDADFVNSFLLHIRNKELETLFLANIEKMAEGFETFGFIEIDRKEVIFHN